MPAGFQDSVTVLPFTIAVRFAGAAGGLAAAFATPRTLFAVAAQLVGRDSSRAMHSHSTVDGDLDTVDSAAGHGAAGL
jgi:hypothetical protein